MEMSAATLRVSNHEAVSAARLEKPQILRTAASGGRCVFDGEKQPARHIELSLARRRQFPRQPNGVFDRGGDMNVGGLIRAACGGGDGFRVSALVIRRRA